MKKLKTGVTTQEVNGKIEVQSPHFKDDNKEIQSNPYTVFVLCVIALACIFVALNINQLIN